MARIAERRSHAGNGFGPDDQIDEGGRVAEACIELRHHGRQVDFGRRTVPSDEIDAADDETQKDDDLRRPAQDVDHIAELDRGVADENRAPDHRDGNGTHHPDRHVGIEQLGNDARRDQIDRRHPERHVDPVVPADTGAKTRTETLMRPVIDSALGRKGRSEFRDHQDIGDQKQDDDDRPPAESRRTDGGRGGQSVKADHARNNEKYDSEESYSLTFAKHLPARRALFCQR